MQESDNTQLHQFVTAINVDLHDCAKNSENFQPLTKNQWKSVSVQNLLESAGGCGNLWQAVGLILLTVRSFIACWRVLAQHQRHSGLTGIICNAILSGSVSQLTSSKEIWIFNGQCTLLLMLLQLIFFNNLFSSWRNGLSCQSWQWQSVHPVLVPFEESGSVCVRVVGVQIRNMPYGWASRKKRRVGGVSHLRLLLSLIFGGHIFQDSFEICLYWFDLKRANAIHRTFYVRFDEMWNAVSAKGLDAEKVGSFSDKSTTVSRIAIVVIGNHWWVNITQAGNTRRCSARYLPSNVHSSVIYEMKRQQFKTVTICIDLNDSCCCNCCLCFNAIFQEERFGVLDVAKRKSKATEHTHI